MREREMLLFVVKGWQSFFIPLKKFQIQQQYFFFEM